MKKILSLLLSLCFSPVFAQAPSRFNAGGVVPGKDVAPEYYTDGYLRYADYEYRPTIKTVMLQVKGVEGSPALLDLESEDQLHLQFDDLDATQKQLYYSIEHCNADWAPSNLMKTRAVQGLQQDLLQDFAYSFNTRQQYIHYDLMFPNDNMKIMMSGNYLLKVFEDNDPQKLVLSRRFMVFKNTAIVSARIKRPSVMELRDTDQEIDVVVDISKMNVINPASSVKVMIRQNGRWDNALFMKPFSLNQNSISYDFDDGSNCFPGGNEFRAADIRSLRMNSISVKKINRDSSLVQVSLLPDQVRSFDSYQSLPDANGNYYIRNAEGSEPEKDGDYVWVDFRLPFEAPVRAGNLYLFGAFSNWQFSDAFKLSYKYASKAYTGRILLKQGIYNYCYSFLPLKGGSADLAYVEGSFFNTENDYMVLVYSRTYTNDFDELVGLSRVNSIKNQ